MVQLLYLLSLFRLSAGSYTFFRSSSPRLRVHPLQLPIGPKIMQEPAKRQWLESTTPVGGANRKEYVELIEQHPVGFAQCDGGIPDVDRLGRRPVDLDDLEVLATEKSAEVVEPDVEPSEPELRDRPRNHLDPGLEFGRHQRRSVPKDRTLAVVPRKDQGKDLTRIKDSAKVRAVPFLIDPGKMAGPRIRLNQLPESPASIARQSRKDLDRHPAWPQPDSQIPPLASLVALLWDPAHRQP